MASGKFVTAGVAARGGATKTESLVYFLAHDATLVPLPAVDDGGTIKIGFGLVKWRH